MGRDPICVDNGGQGTCVGGDSGHTQPLMGYPAVQEAAGPTALKPSHIPFPRAAVSPVNIRSQTKGAVSRPSPDRSI